MPLLNGVIPVIPTPFSEDGFSVDYKSFEKLVELAVDEGANGLGLLAGGAEFYKLTQEERNNLLRTAVEVNNKRVPVLVTISAHATRNAVQEAELAMKMGADAINVMPPSFAFPNAKMVARHLVEVSKSVPLPVMIQYAPALTGGAIANETFTEIGESSGGELYIKVEASPTGPVISSVIAATHGKYNIVAGNGGECMFEAFSRGACAVMPGLAMVKPYCEIYNAFVEGDKDKAFRLFNMFLPYVHFILRDIEQFVAMEKIILVERGVLHNAVCREPNNYPDEWSKRLLLSNYRFIKEQFKL